MRVTIIRATTTMIMLMKMMVMVMIMVVVVMKVFFLKVVVASVKLSVPNRRESG